MKVTSHVSGSLGCFRSSSSTSGGDLTADETEELPGSVQDAEICLLKSGEITYVHATDRQCRAKHAASYRIHYG